MRRTFIFLVVCFFLCSGAAVYGDSPVIEPFTLPSVRFSALGGNHTAVGDSFYTIFTNPASFVDIDGQFSAGEISLTSYGPAFELLDLFQSNAGSFNNLDLSGLLGKGGFAAGVDMAGPLSLGWVGNGFGFGIFNRVKADAVVSGTNLRPGVSAELILVGGYSFRPIDKNGHTLDLGMLGKGFFRGAASIVTPILNIGTIGNDPLGRPLVTYLGMGLDLGLRYTFQENLSISVVCFDLFAPVLVTPYATIMDFMNHVSPSGTSSYALVSRRLDFGFRWRIQNTFIDRYFTNLTLMVDYHDLLDLFSMLPSNPILNVGIGVEITVLHNLSIRFGMTDALPAFGVGIDLNFLTLDFSIFGRELGLDPGKNSTYCLGLGLLFRY